MRISLSMLGMLVVLVVVAMLAAKLMVKQLPPVTAQPAAHISLVRGATPVPGADAGAVAAAQASAAAQNAAAATTAP